MTLRARLNILESSVAKPSRRRLKRVIYAPWSIGRAPRSRFSPGRKIIQKSFTRTADPGRVIATIRRGFKVLD